MTRMRKTFVLFTLFAVAGLLAASAASAQIYVKKADNFIVVMDTSGSMGEQYMTTGKSKMQVSKDILHYMNDNIPELGYNSGLYTLSATEPVSKVGPWNPDTFNADINTLPESGNALGFGAPTPLGRTMRNLVDVVEPLEGRTVIYLFSDGRNTDDVDPVAMAQRMANRKDVCFLIISTAEGTTVQDRAGAETLKKIAAVNECSRIVDFDYAAVYPQVCTGELCAVIPQDVTLVVPETAPMTVIEEGKAVEADVMAIRFDFDKSEIKPEFAGVLDTIGQKMQADPKATVYIAGYTDSIGTVEYNMGLSKRRAMAAADYLSSKYDVAQDRMTVRWFSEYAPVAPNDTPEGRALNRRDELIVIPSM